MKRFFMTETLGYIVVPKAASRSIIYFMNQTSNNSFGAKVFIAPYAPFQIAKDYNAAFLNWCKNKFKFSFVRNPINRIVSTYRDKIQMPEYIDFLQKTISPLFKLSMPFNEFIDLACSIPDEQSDQHMIPQHCLIYHENKLMLDFVGRVENIKKDFNIICQKFNLKVSLPILNSTNPTKNYLTYYNNSLLKKVEKKYIKDFELFYPEGLKWKSDM